MNRVWVVGLGLGPADIGPRAAEAIAQAEVLAGGARLLAFFPKHPGRRIVLAGGLEAWLDQVALAAQSGRVAVLASGDPGFHGVATALAGRLGPGMLTVLPNVTAMQAACARLGLAWGEAALVSLHAGGGQALPDLWRAMGRADTVALYPGPEHGPAVIAALLLERGQTGWRMHVLENLGAPDEKIGAYDLGQAAAGRFGPLSVVLLTRTARPTPSRLGLPEDAYASDGGLITKAEVRAVAIAKLALGPGMVLWDVGAGSGAVGLEAGLLMPGGRVCAVERDARRIEMIKTNRARYGAAMLDVVQGQAPEALERLPRPHRVFIGGGGRDLAAIIAACAARLAPDGVIVAAVVLLASVEAARGALAQAGLAVDETMVQVCRGQALAGQIMLKAQNPVWLLRGRAGGEAS